MDEAMAMERSKGGSNTPEYEPVEKDQAEGWRRDTPPPAKLPQEENPDA